MRPNIKRAHLRAQRGRAAEHIAEAYVHGLGMRVLATNLRVGYLELDIVAREGPVVAVIEVRTRGARAWQRPLDSVVGIKERRLRRAAAILWDRWWSKLPGVERVRFDVAAVDLGKSAVEYVRAAF